MTTTMNSPKDPGLPGSQSDCARLACESDNEDHAAATYWQGNREGPANRQRRILALIGKSDRLL
jgi:hypothetical protein